MVQTSSPRYTLGQASKVGDDQLSQPEPNDWRTGAADLFEYHEEVMGRLARKNPSVDQDDLNDAFVNAILDLSSEPAKFDQCRGTAIQDFLVGAAQRALLQILRTHGRRRAREEKKATSALSKPDFRVKGFELTTGVADFHLPVNATLGVIDVARPSGDFRSQLCNLAKPATRNTLPGE